MKILTQIVTQSGFHGRCDVPISGTNWRPWNDITIAVYMTEGQANAMFDAASCSIHDCECGGYNTAQPAYCGDLNSNSGTWLVPIEWITNPDILDAIKIEADKKSASEI